ncbi:MAG: hypothetical protein WDZ37_07135 [Solirubrobacterales bacterium]
MVSSRGKRVGLAVCVALVGVNIWTGSPAFALWVGSRAQGGGPPTMTSVAVVIVLMAALSLALVKLLALLNAAYQRSTGHQRTVRTHAPWLRSLGAERSAYPDERPRLTVPERILVAVAVIAILVFEYWFFFLSGSPIDQRNGRSASLPSSQERAYLRLSAGSGATRAPTATPGTLRT